MKIKNLNQDYLSGMVDSFIADYDYHVKPISEEKCLSYSIEFGMNYGIGKEYPFRSAKIIFNWILESRQVCIDEETNSYEDRGETVEDSFIITINGEITNLQECTKKILDKVTENCN